MDPHIHTHFQKADPILAAVFSTIELDLHPAKPRSNINHFVTLVESIVSQQLSTKVADVILARLLSALPDKKITPDTILATDTELLRKQGMSYAKIKYLKDLALKVKEKEIDLEHLDSLSDEEVIVELVKVKGIGRWTAEMFLMFSLERPDVFSTGDLGLKRAIQKIYNLPKEPNEKKLLTLSKKWSPYRTIACRILWRSLDTSTL